MIKYTCIMSPPGLCITPTHTTLTVIVLFIFVKLFKIPNSSAPLNPQYFSVTDELLHFLLVVFWISRAPKTPGDRFVVCVGTWWAMWSENVFGFDFVHFNFFITCLLRFYRSLQLQIFINLCPLWDRDSCRVSRACVLCQLLMSQVWKSNFWHQTLLDNVIMFEEV